jgi:hypothetical protein
MTPFCAEKKLAQKPFRYIERKNMSDKQLPFTPDEIANDVSKMAGKPESQRKIIADKASYKFAELYHETTPEEFKQIYNDAALKSRTDSDKTQKIFCKTTDGKVHDELKASDKNIKEIWIGDPARDPLFNWGNYKVFSQEKEAEKEKKSQASISQRNGMLSTFMEKNSF